MAFNVSSTVPRTISPRWSRIRASDLDHLTHRILITHRLLLHSMKKPSLPKVRKIRHVILVSRLEDDFLVRLLAPNAIFAGIHIEPGGWQSRAQSLINSRSRDCAFKHERNENLLALFE